MTILALAALAWLTLYTAYSVARPAKNCRRCSGWGSKPGRRRRSGRRHCHRCDGTGKRLRVPARVIYRIRGARRRHAELTLRAAQRAAGLAPDRAGQDREQARS